MAWKVISPVTEPDLASIIRTSTALPGCFIAGSVAINVDGKDECAEGAQATLTNGSTQTFSTTATDNYGNFKFDNLEENSGKYTIRITLNGYAAKTIDVEMKESLDAGVFFL